MEIDPSNSPNPNSTQGNIQLRANTGQPQVPNDKMDVLIGAVNGLKDQVSMLTQVLKDFSKRQAFQTGIEKMERGDHHRYSPDVAILEELRLGKRHFIRYYGEGYEKSRRVQRDEVVTNIERMVGIRPTVAEAEDGFYVFCD